MIDHSHSSTTNAMAKKSRRQAPTRYKHNVSFQDNNKELTDEWADITESTGENATQRSTGTLHENDDIIIAQQVYDFNNFNILCQLIISIFKNTFMLSFFISSPKLKC